MAWKDHPLVLACAGVAGVAAFAASVAALSDSSTVHRLINTNGASEAPKPSIAGVPEASPSKLYAYDVNHPVRDGVSAAGKDYSYAAFGCDWTSQPTGAVYCSIWVTPDRVLTLSRAFDRPQLELADGHLVPAQRVAANTDTVGPGFNGKPLWDLNFGDSTVSDKSIVPQPKGKSSLLVAGFPRVDIDKARAVIFKIGAADKPKRLPIVPF